MSTALLLVAVCLSFARTDHKEYRNATPGDCRDCHGGSGVTENHGAFFVSEHKELARKASSNCADCHQQSFCLDCHKGGNVETEQKSLSRRGEYMPKTHRSDFISIHPVKAGDNPSNCYRCHEIALLHGLPHPADSKEQGQHDHPSLTARHLLHRAYRPGLGFRIIPRSARRNLQSCQGCHPQKGDCTNFACHPNLKGR